MQIDRIFFPVRTLGAGERLGIWTIGCPRRCKNCSNPELWNEDASRDISVNEILSIAEKYKNRLDGVTITGGEPFFQSRELLALVEGLSRIGFDDILVFTGYKLEELRKMQGDYLHALEFIGVLIDGEYIDELNDNKGLRGSSNQRIHILNPSLADKYEGAESCSRKSSIINSGGRVMAVGIPLKQG